MSRSLRVAVCGAYAGGLLALREIAASGSEITVVAALEERSAGSTMEHFARKRGLPVVAASEVKTRSFAELLARANTDILISVQLPYLVGTETLKTPPIGCFNLHPSLLPRYAGLHPTAWAIYRGEPEHGATLHWMTPETDAGPIVGQRSVPIVETDTPPLLLRSCLRAGMPLISELLRLASRGVAIPRIEQDLSQREYYSRQIPGDGYIDWNRPAREIVNLVRAFDHRPFPCPWGYLKTQALGAPTAILKAADTGLAANVPPGTIDNSSSQDRICIASFDNWVHIREHLALAPE